MQPGTERRGQPRVRADLSVQLNLETGGSGANIRDISLSGVCCITDRAMPVMTQVELTIVLPTGPDATHPLTCSGAVVRSEPIPTNGDGSSHFETAIFFTQMGEEY